MFGGGYGSRRPADPLFTGGTMAGGVGSKPMGLVSTGSTVNVSMGGSTMPVVFMGEAVMLMPAIPVGLQIPPGLEYMYSIASAHVQQKTDIIEMTTNIDTPNKYMIYNDLGHFIYYAQEVQSQGEFAAAQVVGDSRGFRFQVTDAAGRVIFTIFRSSKLWTDCEMIVEAPPGMPCGYASFQSNILCRGVMTIMDQFRRPILTIPFPSELDAQLSDRGYPLMMGDMLVGHIIRKFPGFAKQVTTNCDNFALTFPPELDVRVKCVLLACAILIDFIDFEDKRDAIRGKNKTISPQAAASLANPCQMTAAPLMMGPGMAFTPQYVQQPTVVQVVQPMQVQQVQYVQQQYPQQQMMQPMQQPPQQYQQQPQQTQLQQPMPQLQQTQMQPMQQGQPMQQPQQTQLQQPQQTQLQQPQQTQLQQPQQTELQQPQQTQLQQPQQTQLQQPQQTQLQQPQQTQLQQPQQIQMQQPQQVQQPQQSQTKQPQQTQTQQPPQQSMMQKPTQQSQQGQKRSMTVPTKPAPGSQQKQYPQTTVRTQAAKSATPIRSTSMGPSRNSAQKSVSVNKTQPKKK